MTHHRRLERSRPSVSDLFAVALEDDEPAFAALLDRAVCDVGAVEALSALVTVECDRLERAGRLGDVSVASSDQILAAVRDAAKGEHAG